MSEHIHYGSYMDYMVKYDKETFTLTMLHVPTNSAANLTLDGLYYEGERVFGVEEYTSCQVQNTLGIDHHKLSILFDTDVDIPKCAIHATITPKGITMVFNRIGYYTVRMTGDIVHGKNDAFFAIDTNNIVAETICAEMNPADCCGNAVYNKQTDSAFAIEGVRDLSLSYHPDEKKYGLVLKTYNEGLSERIHFSVKKDVLKQISDLPDRDYAVKYDEKTFTMTVLHLPTKSEANVTFDGLYENGVRVFGMDEYKSCRVQQEKDAFSVSFDTDSDMPNCVIRAAITSKGVAMEIGKIGPYTLRATGDIAHGETKEFFAINTKDTATEAIRAAIGPAASAYDNAVYNKQTDSAFAIEGCRDFALSYDWDKEKYGFVLKTYNEGLAEKILFSVKPDMLKDKYDIEFAPLKKRGPYDAPPAGWMTWYAVKFGAGEEAVLRNTRFQEEHLKDFGANTIWVDWEWCHQKYETERFDGVNSFNPDPKKYPNGLGVVAQAIKKAGFVPALWLGFTNDACMTEYEQEHPEISLSHHDTWSGKYYYDISHPEYLNGFMVKAIQQVKDWGYEAVKFDTLPNCITAHERYHGNMYNPDLTTYAAYRGMLEKMRELLGEDYYMLACSGDVDPAVLWGTGVFDAARVGPDVFTWKNFVYTISRIRQFYPLHNVALLNDPDNLVLREEFSTYGQAVSRMSVVSLLGLPMTFGDDLPKLPEERLDLLKRALPVMDVHPTDFNNAICDGKTQVIALNIEMPFERYLVAGVMNLTEEAKTRDISLKETLRLPEDEYLVYDYFKKEFLGTYKDSLMLTVDAFDTKILSFRKKSGKPQVISTSRHITQGAAEIKAMHWDENANTLCITSALVKQDPYTVTVYIPKGYTFVSCNQGESRVDGNILTVTVVPDKNGEYELTVQFKN